MRKAETRKIKLDHLRMKLSIINREAERTIVREHRRLYKATTSILEINRVYYTYRKSLPPDYLKARS